MGRSAEAMKGSRGITLAELLIVIVILGILGGIAAPQFFPQKEKAEAAEAVVILSAIRLGEINYRSEYGEYLEIDNGDYLNDPALWEKLGMEPPLNNHWEFEMTSVQGTCVANRSASASDHPPQKYVDRTIVLDMDGEWSGTHPFGPNPG